MIWLRYLAIGALLLAALYCLGRDATRLTGSAHAALARGEEWQEEVGLGWFFAGLTLLAIAAGMIGT